MQVASYQTHRTRSYFRGNRLRRFPRKQGVEEDRWVACHLFAPDRDKPDGSVSIKLYLLPAPMEARLLYLLELAKPGLAPNGTYFSGVAKQAVGNPTRKRGFRRFQ